MDQYVTLATLLSSSPTTPMAINQLDVPPAPMLPPTTPPGLPRDNFRLPPPAPERPRRPPFRVVHISDEDRESSRKHFRKELFKPRPGELSFVRYYCDLCAYAGPRCAWRGNCDTLECPVCGCYSQMDEDWIRTS